MNIFCLEPSADNEFGVDWEASARALDDLRISKMGIEAVQIVSSALWERELRDTLIDAPMQPTHLHHQCVRWARVSVKNCAALLIYAEEMLREWSLRFDWVGPELHGAWIPLQECKSLIRAAKNEQFLNAAASPPPKCVPAEFQHLPLVDAYRAFWRSKKRHVYKRCASAPEWMNG